MSQSRDELERAAREWILAGDGLNHKHSKALLDALDEARAKDKLRADMVVTTCDALTEKTHKCLQLQQELDEARRERDALLDAVQLYKKHRDEGAWAWIPGSLAALFKVAAQIKAEGKAP